MDHLHAEGPDNVQLNPEHHGNHLHVEEGEDQVNPEPHEEEGKVKVLLNPKRHDGYLHAEEGEEQIPPERHGGHLQAEEVEYKVQLITEHMVITCTPGRSRGPSQMCPQVTFSVWISELIFSRAKSYILSLSLTAAN